MDISPFFPLRRRVWWCGRAQQERAQGPDKVLMRILVSSSVAAFAACGGGGAWRVGTLLSVRRSAVHACIVMRLLRRVLSVPFGI